MNAKNNTADNSNVDKKDNAAKDSSEKKPENSDSQDTVSVLDRHKNLTLKRAAIEASDMDEMTRKFALLGIESEIGKLESSLGNALDSERLSLLYQCAREVQKGGFVDRKVTYLVTFDPEYVGPADSELGSIKFTVEEGKGSRAKKAKGEVQEKGRYNWIVGAFGMQTNGDLEEGARKLILDLAESVLLVTAETSDKLVKGVCARLGWKVHPSLGPVLNHMQGKKTKDSDGKKIFLPHYVGLVDDGSKFKTYAHRRALVVEAKTNRSGAYVKNAESFLTDLLKDCMVEDGFTSKKKKISRDDLTSYIVSLKGRAEESEAEKIN